MTIPKSASDPRSFWDRKARTFPRHSLGDDCYEESVLSLARRNGVIFKVKLILDVGCGTGMFTIRLAAEAERVVALDISGCMLDILKMDAQKAGAANISVVMSDWLEYEADEAPSLIFCSMTPAVATDAGRERLLIHSGAQVCVLTASRPFRSQIMDAISGRFGPLPPIPPRSRPLRDWLRERGVPASSHPLSGRWTVPQSLEDITESVACWLCNFGITPEEGELREALLRFRGDDGLFTEVTDYSLEMVIWRNP